MFNVPIILFIEISEDCTGCRTCYLFIFINDKITLFEHTLSCLAGTGCAHSKLYYLLTCPLNQYQIGELLLSFKFNHVLSSNRDGKKIEELSQIDKN